MARQQGILAKRGVELWIQEFAGPDGEAVLEAMASEGLL